MKHHILLLLSLLAVFASCGDDLAGTYSDFTDGKPFHYAGKVKNVTVNPGWQCLRATWTLSADPAVKNILVTCASESDTIRQTLDPTATSCKIENLANKDYTVTVQSLDTDGSLSLADGIVSRPYTYDHESVRAFTRGVSKAFLAKTHLLLVMGNWEDGIEDFHISFTTTDGTETTKQLSQQDFAEKYIDLPSVDTSKPIVLHRTGRIEGCEDLIQFEDYTLTKEVLLNTDFASEMTERYGMSNDDETGFAEKMQSLDVDHSLYTLEDLLYFTNVKTVNLGKNRYFDGTHFAWPTVDQTAESKWAMEKMHEIYGTRFVVYGDSYLPGFAMSGLTRKAANTLPPLGYLSTTGWTITNSESNNNNVYLSDLLDNNPLTTWSSWPAVSTARTMQLTIDMKKENTVHGVKIVQNGNRENSGFQPAQVSLQYSVDGKSWSDLCHVVNVTLGTALGEATVVAAKSAAKARYLRLSVKELTYQGQTKVSLADIAVY